MNRIAGAITLVAAAICVQAISPSAANPGPSLFFAIPFSLFGIILLLVGDPVPKDSHER